MSGGDANRSLEEAFERIEEAILPSLSITLDALLEAAALARPGADAEAHAAELRTLAFELESATRQMEALSPARAGPKALYRAA
jgi:hypothetical protein